MVSLSDGTAVETPMDDAQIDALLTGNTVYLIVPSGEASVLFSADGRAAAEMPNGTKMAGAWRIAQGAYCIDWDGGLQNSCTQVVKVVGAVVLRDAATGEPRGTIARIVPGVPA